MRHRRHAQTLFLLAPLVMLAGLRAARAAPEEVPLPISKTAVLKDREVVYVVEGRVTIPAGIEITLQKGVRLRGRGDAVLEVQGAFVAHGIKDTEIGVTGVKIVPAAGGVQQLHVDYCLFGGGAGLVTEKDEPTDGLITAENCKFSGEPGIELEMLGGKVKVMSVEMDTNLRLRAIDPPGRHNRATCDLRTSNLKGGIDVQAFSDLTVRGNILGGARAFMRDNVKLGFDGNKVHAGELVFEQSESGNFGKTKIDKCDVFSMTLRVHAPVGKKKRETVTIQKCYFSGELDVKKLEGIVQDREDDPQNAVKVLLKKPMKRPLNLAKEWY
jgi:hypothetical protein